jgi:hypothetical protein
MADSLNAEFVLPEVLCMNDLQAMLADSAYQAYTYAYPHKTAYRPLEKAIALKDVWSTERRDALFLYLHIPFCEMRCGFCNLFTQTHPQDNFVEGTTIAPSSIARRAICSPWYQQAMARLSHLPQVVKVAIQTNLSCHLDWVDRCDKQKLGLWTTYHPTEVDRDRFVNQCWELDRRGVRFSVGIVGLKEHQGDSACLCASSDCY